MHITPRFTAALAALALGASFAAQAAYPERPIRLVVPWPAGGSTDGVARLVGKHLQERLKQPVVIDNKAGASGNIGTAEVARAAPDGYTLLMSSGPFAINPSLYKKLPFDAARDFVPVTQLTATPSLFVVHPSTPAKTMQEFVTLSRNAANPVTVATPGSGSAQHLAVELLKKKLGLSILHVPYKGGAPAMNDLLAGQVQAMMVGFTEGLEYARAGKLRALAVSSKGRSSLLPDVPSLMELGFADAGTSGWNGIHVPARTPPEIVGRLNTELNAILDLPEVKQQLTSVGFEVRRTSQQDFSSYVAQQMTLWKEAVALTGAKVE